MKDEQIRDLRIKSDLCFNLCIGLRRAVTELEISVETRDAIVDTISRLSAVQKQLNNEMKIESLEEPR